MKLARGLAALALAVAAPSFAQDGAARTETLDLDLPGRLRDVQRIEAGGRAVLYLLHETTDEELWQLRRVDLGAGQQEIVGDLDPETRPRLDRIVASDARAARLAVIADGGLWSVEVSDRSLPARPSVAVEPGVEAILHDRRPWLAAADIGEVVVYDLGAGGREIGRQVSPVEAVPLRSALELASPPVHAVTWPDGRVDFAIGPQLLGNLRLRTQFVELGGAEPASAFTGDESPDPEDDGPTSYWAMLPGLEKLERSFFLEHDGRPVLGVVTLRADKQGILERKKLRMFDLVTDRTRTGARPFFEMLTSSRMWQQLKVALDDFDGDGELDLALLQPEGLGGGKLVFDLYSAKGRSFETRSRRFVIKESESWMSIEHDWTGDGLPDVLVRSGSQVSAYSVAGRRDRKLTAPDWSMSFVEPPRPQQIDEDRSPRRRVHQSDGVLVLSAQHRDVSDDDGELLVGDVAVRIVDSRSIPSNP